MTTMTPSKLRAASTTGAEWLPIPASCGEMLADAIEIADSCARSDIECFAYSPGDGWYDTTRVLSRETKPRDSVADKQAAAYDLSAVEQAVRYLLARGLIERHPERPDWVRVKA